MSDRNLSASDKKMRDLLRDMTDRVNRLENGGALRGRVGFGEKITLADVEVAVVDTGNNSRKVIFTNLKTGSSNEIPLP